MDSVDFMNYTDEDFSLRIDVGAVKSYNNNY